MFSNNNLIFAALIFGVSYVSASEPIVETPLGLVRGVHKLSYDGNIFSSFEGIPYAEAPLGNLRFKDPLPISKWTGIWDANSMYKCTQVVMGITSNVYEGNEDCLYVQVYVPRELPTDKDNLDVIVHIHGGAFMFGSHSFYSGPEYLMDRDVIFVTLNYRLGPFGFLSTEDDVVSGNMGLKDQTMALKWIQENIASFGGNPNSVTITGMSAGGASVHYHYLSPLSKGLFHSGYSKSGATLTPWALQEAAGDKAHRLAAHVGCDNKNSQLLVDCLRDRSAQQIVEALIPVFYKFHMFPFATFGPVIDSYSTNSFLPDHPIKLLKSGKVADLPWISSITSEEGIYPTGYLTYYLDEVNNRWEELLPLILECQYSLQNIDKRMFAEEIKNYYFQGKDLDSSNIKSLIQLCSDRHFNIDIEKAFRLQAKVNKAPVYVYKFSYRGEKSLSQIFHGNDEDMGVSHGDDVFYLYKNALAPEKLTSDDCDMKTLFLDMLTNFSKTGIPTFGTVDWTPLENGTLIDYLDIKSPKDYKMAKVEEFGPQEFWSKLQLKENENYEKKVL